MMPFQQVLLVKLPENLRAWSYFRSMSLLFVRIVVRPLRGVGRLSDTDAQNRIDVKGAGSGSGGGGGGGNC